MCVFACVSSACVYMFLSVCVSKSVCVSACVRACAFIFVYVRVCVSVCVCVTLGGDGILGAGGGAGLGAVPTGILQRVSAALLLLHAQAPGQDHGQVTGCRGHLLTMLGHTPGHAQNSTHTHTVCPLVRNMSLVFIVDPLMSSCCPPHDHPYLIIITIIVLFISS